ncbi:MAG: hypothetical protein H6866_02460 [Rhodospirillales bacterium]|nr:MAG: hypothetical protein H6866_02460 [Rhodospirillales bacterium]
MEGAPLSLILDVVVLVLLGLTIGYAARLSLQLRRLRDSKSDLDRVVRDLMRNLDRAERAIAGFRQTAMESGSELQNHIDRAMAISDELQLITESGDRLAARLDGLVDRARPMAAAAGGAAGGERDGSKKPGAFQAREPVPVDTAGAVPASSATSYATHLRKLDAGEVPAGMASSGAAGSAGASGAGMFAIRDPDAERGLDPAASAGEELYSDAERDLFRAMKHRPAR